MFSIQNLHEAILLIIHLLLDLRSQVRLQSTCHRLADVMGTMSLNVELPYRNVVPPDRSIGIRDAMVMWMRLRRPYIERLTVYRPLEVELELIQSLPALHMLSLSGTLPIDMSCLSTLTQLQHITLLHPNPGYMDRLEHSWITTLRGLQSIEWRDDLNLDNLDMLCNLPNLSRLNCHYCRRLEDIPFVSSLTHLNLQTMELTNFEALWSMPKLKCLYLDHAATLNNLNEFTIFKDLRILHIRMLKSLTSLDGLWGLTKLQELNCFGCNITSLNGISALTNLTFLNISACSELTSLNSISALTNLTFLNCSHCIALTIQGCIDISTLTSLRVLDFSNMNVDLPDLSCLKRLTRIRCVCE
jgi:internalin A